MGHACFLILSFSALLETYLLGRLLSKGSPHALLILFAAVTAMSELVLFLETASFLHGLESGWILASGSILLLIQGLLIRVLSRRYAVAEKASPSGWNGLLWLAGLAVALRIITYAPPPIYHDGLTYHLSFAAEWLKNGNLNTPFQAYGDLAPPFYPIDSSLLYLWNLIFTRSDFWARFTQAPFLIVIAAAVLSICENLQTRFQTGVVATMTLFTIRILRYAHRDQGNDVIVAALLLAAVAFLVEIHRSRSKLAFAGFPLAVSLAIGTKYLALAYVPPLVCIYLWLAWKERSPGWLLWTAFTLVCLASFAYVRNWYVTGSALYPASFDFPGLRAHSGSLDLYTHPFAERCRSFSEFTSVLGTSWLLIAGGTLVFCVVRITKVLRSVESLLLSISVVSVVAFYWIVPYRHCRFLLFPLLVLVPVFAKNVGELPLFNQPFFIVSVDSLSRHWKKLFALSCVVVLGLCFRIPSYEHGKYDLWASQKVAGRHYGPGWKWIQERERASGPLRIAMAATQNAPYPLYGSTLDNTIFFLPKDGRKESLRYGSTSRDLLPFQDISEQEWTNAMLQLKPDYFFSTIDMTVDTFGKEDEWARKYTNVLSLVYQDPEVRIYRVKE
jgi:hypothetical protein